MRKPPLTVFLPSVASLSAPGLSASESEARIDRYASRNQPIAYGTYVSAAADVQRVMPSSEERREWRQYLAEKLDVPADRIDEEPEWQSYRGFVTELELETVTIAATAEEDPIDADLGAEDAPDVLWLPDPPDGRPGFRLRLTGARSLLGRFRFLRCIDVLPVPRRAKTPSS